MAPLTDPVPSGVAFDHPASRKGSALPCPFCGGTAGAVFRENIGCYRYRCDCGASPAPVSKLAYLDDQGDPEADAIGRWNERVGVMLPAEMTPEIRKVLGLMIFRTGPLASLYRAAGEDILRKIEQEQAFVLWRFLRLALQHGVDWHDASCGDVEVACRLAVAKLPAEPKPTGDAA